MQEVLVDGGQFVTQNTIQVLNDLRVTFHFLTPRAVKLTYGRPVGREVIHSTKGIISMPE